MRLGKRLGGGGMGTVWEASDELLGRSVAVKELHVGDGTRSAGALREARTVAQIKHPHVVVVRDVVEHDGRPFIVMELVEGRSLTGASPFHRDSLGGVLHAVVSDGIRPPAQAEPLLPVILGLPERDPERRLGAAEAERLLSAYVTGGTLALPDLADVCDRVPGPKRPRPVRRTWLIAAALVVVVADGGVGAASLLGGGTESRAPRAAPTAPGTAPPAAAFPPTASAATASPAPASPAPAAPGAGAPVTRSPSWAPSTPAPPGYRILADPQGFALAVPDGYQRTPDDQRVFRRPAHLRPLLGRERPHVRRLGVRPRQPARRGQEPLRRGAGLLRPGWDGLRAPVITGPGPPDPSGWPGCPGRPG